MARIIVIDDDPSTLFLMRETFAVSGEHTVRTQGDSKQAFDELQAATELPAVIVLDVLMPGMSGLEFAKRLGADLRLKAIPIVIISADPAQQKAFEEMPNVVSFHRKPCDLGELRAAVTKALGKKTAP